MPEYVEVPFRQMDKAEADAELTRLQRAERAWHRNHDTLRYKNTAAERHIDRLTTLAAEADAAIRRRQDTRGDLFTMTVGGGRYAKRRGAGQRLRQSLQHQAAEAGDHDRQPVPVRHGSLAGFDITGNVRRVLGMAEITISLDGAPEAELRLTPDELLSIDPAKLIIRLENRLLNLETIKAKAIGEIDRLTVEISRARQDIARAFPQGGQLTKARDRARRLDEQLREAALAPKNEQERQPAAENSDQSRQVHATSSAGQVAGQSMAIAQVSRRSSP